MRITTQTVLVLALFLLQACTGSNDQQDGVSNVFFVLMGLAMLVMILSAIPPSHEGSRLGTKFALLAFFIMVLASLDVSYLSNDPSVVIATFLAAISASYVAFFKNKRNRTLSRVLFFLFAIISLGIAIWE